MITLTESERFRFATWLEEGADSDQKIAKQAELMGAVGEVIAKRNKVRATAYLIVARDLRSIQEESI